MKQTTEIKDTDTISIVRICIASSDTLVDTDTLAYLVETKQNKHFKFKFKRAVNKWVEFSDKFNDYMLELFHNADESAVVDLQRHYRVVCEQIHLVNEEITAMCLIYCKCVSIMREIKSMQYTDRTLYELYVLSYNVMVEFEREHKALLKIKDEHGNGLLQIINGFQLLSSKIMYKEDEQS